MIDSFDLYNDFNGLVNTFQGGFFPPETVFIRAVNNISTELWEKWTRQAEKSEEAKNNLLPFLVKKNMLTDPQKSFYSNFLPPEDFGRFASARILVHRDKTYPDKSVDGGECCNGKFKTDEEIAEDYYNEMTENNVEMIDNIKWTSALNHLKKKPSFEKPKITQINGGWSVSPRTVSVVVLNYYRRPKEATFKYTTADADVQTGAGDYLIYNKSASQALEWDQTLKNEFLWRLGVRFGLYTRDQFVTAVTSQEKLIL